MTRPEHRPADATRAITAGRAANEGALSVPVWTSAVWESDSAAAAAAGATAIRPERFYARHGNPTVAALCSAIAELEHAEEALAVASGMAALSTVVFGLCSAGDHIVASRHCYAGTTALLTGPARRLGITTTFVDATNPGELAGAVRHGETTLVIVETPSNPLLGLVDLDEVGAITGPFTVVDSTFATPLGQRPLDHGVDIVMHSATKGIAGHNDVTMGVLAAERDIIDALWSYSILHGAVPSPFDAMLTLRGLRTLDVRHERQSATALELARRLEAHPAVSAVHHPGLESHHQHDLARAQLTRTGSMLSFELAEPARWSGMVESMRLVRCATSLGGPETLVCQPSTTTHAALDADDRTAIGITDGLIRMSVGLEAIDDLWAEIAAVLD